jgi:UDP-N-acetylglucosamine transferase subunit ALG13
MILVTLGTQDKEFKRLLDIIEDAIENDIIKEEVVVQAGSTKYDSKNMKIFDVIPMNEFDKLMKKCDILITHGGVGSIITGLKNNKKIIAMARLKIYKESANDHQLQIIDNFSKEGYLLKLDNNNLAEVLNEAKHFKPQKFISNTDNMIKLISDYISKN